MTDTLAPTPILSPISLTVTEVNEGHYLRPQKTSHFPRRYVFFDTEAHRTQNGAGEDQTWRLGVTGTVYWRERTRTWSPVALARHETPESLWELVTAIARKDQRTVVVAHNLGYDLRISNAFELLPQMGWSVTKVALSGEHVGLDLRKGSLSLVLVDSLTVITHSLATVGEWRQDPKPELPGDDAPAEAWWERCEADVRLLTWAYMEVCRWMSDNDLGGWARSGSGLGWHALIRNHLHEKVLVHNDPELLDIEGQSCYSARTEAFKIGKYRNGPFTVWDYEKAYAHICAAEPLPARHLGVTRGGGLDRMVARSADFSYLVHARIETDVPMLPWRDVHGVCWPVGSFSGWYWQWELAVAEEAGARVRIGEAHRYAASPWLASWAEWCFDVMEDQSSPEAKVHAAVVKHWYRAVVGRSAMKYKDWGERGPAYEPGVSYWTAADLDRDLRGAILQLGGQRWETWSERWWDQALPQLLSSVMAHVRVRLWDAIEIAGQENVYHCDTDCLITGPAGSERLMVQRAAGALPGLRAKDTLPDIEPRAPTLVEGSTYRRLAGVPRQAVRVDDTTYLSTRWEGVTSSLAGGTPNSVRLSPLRQRLELADWRRRHNPDGSTYPYTVINDVRQMPEEMAQ